MLIHRMTASECRALLARTRLGRIACARSAQPYVVPVSVYFDAEDEAVYGFSTVGKKIRWMRENPLVCIEVEEVVSRTEWRTVVAFGRYQEIRRTGPRAELMQRAMELFGAERQWWLPGTATVAPDDQHTIAVIYRVLLTRISGRRAGRPVKDRA